MPVYRARSALRNGAGIWPRRALFPLPALLACCTKSPPPAPAVLGLPQVLDRRRAEPTWLGEVRGRDGSFRATLTSPYPVARLVQQRFAEGLERRRELALDTLPTLGLRLEIHRLEVVVVTELSALADIDLSLYDLASGRERYRARLLDTESAAIDPSAALTTQAWRLAQAVLSHVTDNALDVENFQHALRPSAALS